MISLCSRVQIFNQVSDSTPFGTPKSTCPFSKGPNWLWWNHWTKYRERGILVRWFQNFKQILDPTLWLRFQHLNLTPSNGTIWRYRKSWTYHRNMFFGVCHWARKFNQIFDLVLIWAPNLSTFSLIWRVQFVWPEKLEQSACIRVFWSLISIRPDPDLDSKMMNSVSFLPVFWKRRALPLSSRMRK